MDTVLKEPAFLKLSSSILTINYPKSAKFPESTYFIQNAREEHLFVAVLACRTHPIGPLAPLSYLSASLEPAAPKITFPGFWEQQARPLLDNSKKVVLSKLPPHQVYSASPFINRKPSPLLTNRGWETAVTCPRIQKEPATCGPNSCYHTPMPRINPPA